MSAYQYPFKITLPSCMHYTHYVFQTSSLVDLIRVTVGPNERCAPEQFIHTKTPKSNEAPIIYFVIQQGDLPSQSAQNMLSGRFSNVPMIFYCWSVFSIRNNIYVI